MSITAEQFREKILENYKSAMQDCQIPTGTLAQLNPAEFYAFCLYEQLQNRKEYPERYIEEIDSEVVKHLKYWVNSEIQQVTQEEQNCNERVLIFHEGELEALNRVKKWVEE